MTFSVVIASQTEERARPTLESLVGFGEQIDACVLTGFSNILDAYREGQRRAKHDLICYVHNDVTFLSGGIEASAEALLRESRAGWIGLCGSLDPIACGCVYHKPSAAVGCVIPGMRGGEGECSFMGRLCKASEPRFDALNLAQEVRCLDAGILFTERHDWAFEPTSRENFLGAYDADISYEAVEKGWSLWVLPLPAIHWGADETTAEMVERDRMFLAGRTERTLERWSAFTVPCLYGVPPERACRASAGILSAPGVQKEPAV